MRATLVDTSRHQGRIDAQKLMSYGFDGICARATIGWGYIDSWYAHTFAEAKEANMLMGAYHVLWPENRNPRREAGHFADHFHVQGEPPDFIVADLELMHGLKAEEVAHQIEELLPALEYETGMRPIIYTGSWFWNSPHYLGLVTPIGIEEEYPLWEAEYLTKRLGKWHPNGAPQEPKEPVMLGNGWKDWTFWQWTNKGAPIGVESSTLDYDVFNGTLDELKAFLGIGKPPLTLEQKVDRLWEAHPELH